MTPDASLADVDAVVNADGVAGAIRRRGGPSIQQECDRIGHCPVGQAVVTGAGELKASRVIHAVGPVWRGGSGGEDAALASAVGAALARAEEVGARSVAVPAISTGVFGLGRKDLGRGGAVFRGDCEGRGANRFLPLRRPHRRRIPERSGEDGLGELWLSSAPDALRPHPPPVRFSGRGSG